MIADSNTSQQSGTTTTHTVALPATEMVVGRLLAVVTCTNGSGLTITGALPDNFTRANLGDTPDQIDVWFRTVDGTEGSTVQYTTDVAVRSAHASVVLLGWDGVTTPEFATIATGLSGTTPNPNAVTPAAGEGLYGYLTLLFGESGTNFVITAPPTGYSGLVLSQASGGSGGASVALAEYDPGAATSSEDAGAWTTSDDDNWAATTVAITLAAAANSAFVFGSGFLTSQGLHGGEGRALGFDYPYALGEGLKGGLSASAMSRAHGYMLVEGIKVVVAGQGYALARELPFGLAHGFKAGFGYEDGYDGAVLYAESSKGGLGNAQALDHAYGEAEGSKGGAGYTESMQAPIVLANGSKGGLSQGGLVQHPYLLVFGSKGGGGTAGEGFALSWDHGRLLVLGEKAGIGDALSLSAPRLLVRGFKKGTGRGLDFGSPYLLSEGHKGGVAFAFDYPWAEAMGEHAGVGYGFVRAHGYLVGTNIKFVVLTPINSKTGPALYEPMFGPALKG